MAKRKEIDCETCRWQSHVQGVARVYDAEAGAWVERPYQTERCRYNLQIKGRSQCVCYQPRETKTEVRGG